LQAKVVTEVILEPTPARSNDTKTAAKNADKITDEGVSSARNASTGLAISISRDERAALLHAGVKTK